MSKLLIICGPTATGKTSLAIRLAKKFGGEIISADSRQVYKGMDVGVGKDLPTNSKLKTQNSKLHIDSEIFSVGYRLKENIPVWLVDVVDPDYSFNVGEYSLLAQKAIKYLWKKEKLPIVVGGTGLYIRSLIKPLIDTQIPPNKKLRSRLEKMDVGQLQTELKKTNEQAFTKLNNSDQQNPRRLVRSIEKELWKKKHGKLHNLNKEYYSKVNSLLIGLTTDKNKLYQNINQRVEKRVKQGIVNEIKQLLNKGYKWNLPAMSGLGYRQWKEYFSSQEEILKNKIIQQWKYDEHKYARRQMTWFKKMKNINWFDISDIGYESKIIELIKSWYTKIS